MQDFPIEVDKHFMQQALALARLAANHNEVPVGAVIVRDQKIIGTGYNQPISGCDPSLHAEIVAMRAAAAKVGNYRLINSTIYVSLEPCMMCLGALIHARIARIVYATSDLKSGVLGGAINMLEHKCFNHYPQHELIADEALKESARSVLQEFFQQRRRR